MNCAFRYSTAENLNIPRSPAVEGNIIGRREIEPLLAKAAHVLSFYRKALDCSVLIQDRTGAFINLPEYEACARACEFCKKFCCFYPEESKNIHPTGGGETVEEINMPAVNTDQMSGGDYCFQNTRYSNFDTRAVTKLRSAAASSASKFYPGEGEHPAEELKSSIQARYAACVNIYTCRMGFVYWNSPLYKNGRYAGALTAGQVLSCGREAAAKKICAYCTDKNAAKKITAILESVPEKTREEIQAMAGIFAVCAAEIPEQLPHRSIWLEKTAGPHVSGKRIKTTRVLSNDSLPEYPLEKERRLLAAFRRGDRETGGRILKELINCIFTAASGNLEIIRFKAIELLVLLSRAARNTPLGERGENFREANIRYFERISESKTQEELVANLSIAAERMSGSIFSFQGLRHASVLRRAERYIWENYTRKLSLEEIAKASGLSAPYFSSIFKEEMGENLSGFLNRLRVERAATLLTETGKPLGEIARLCGFVDQSWFSKIFKNYTGLSPGKHREQGGRLTVRTERKNRHAKTQSTTPP